ncbi:MAG: TIGR02302 family protein [Methylobacterium sp.]|nr:TIGR02302 family protein [Methylobacterium sp.]MCA3606166.1 TIGR02302 family protein [Methylobacterium sp.]MCA3609298.1 TIGR02302 family protein [Methylobacterium sp.]MCA3618365.1 TIGR02302 family protein [Methylobacterium sp.]MCA3621978.1 TIGR02302 family protein [Methylobacterium sp.]
MPNPNEQSRDDRTRASGMEVSRRALGLRFHRTAFALFVERIAPLLVGPLSLILLFVALAWTGWPSQLEPTGRAVLAGAFAIGIVILAFPLLRFRLPGTAEVEKRLDLSRPDMHRPLATLADAPPPGTDPVALAVWEAHQARARAMLDRLEATPGDARLRWRDPLALRIVAPLALVAAAFMAGDDRQARLAAAFDFSTPLTPPVPPRLDAWIDPPAYTGRPPIFLTGTVTLQPGEAVRAPIGSILIVRTTRGTGTKPDEAAHVTLQHGTGLEPVKEATSPAGQPVPPPNARPGVETLRRTITGSDLLKIIRDGREIAQIPIAVIPDRPPAVDSFEATAESASPERQSPGGIRLAFTLDDDYGIAKGEVVMERATNPRPGHTPRTLYPAPRADLPLRLGPGEIAVPTEDHPWAGEEVNIRIRVEDDIGQKAESEAKVVRLPQKPFSHPLARALVEQRRNLVFAPDSKQDVVFALDALLFEPERFTPGIGEFLMLDSLRQGIRSARGDDALKEMVDRLWEVALYLENGDMTEAERRLREAEQRLREALEREAPQNEIRRLTQELRRAMEEFLREFAERALRDRDQNTQDRSPVNPERFLTQRDLQDMLRRIEEMARSGNMAEARRMLEELRQLMENLRSARRQQADPRMQELGRQIEELDRLQREQRDLRDRTFRQGQQQRQQQRGQQNQRQQGQRGQQGQQGQQGGEQGEMTEQQLRDMQQALRDRLQQLRDRLRERGLQEGEGFGEADQGMGDAEGQLGQGQPGQATEGQQRALDGLGRAAEGMAQQLQQQMGENPGEGEGEGPGEPGPGMRGRAENRTDPLGRPQANQRRDMEDGNRFDVPDRDALQGSISERAERVLRELRKRLGEFERPREELEYLERLLRQR